MRVNANGEVRITASQASRVLTGPQSDAARMLRTTARRVETSAKLRAPVDTGNLRNSHRRGPVTVEGGKISTYVESPAEYAAAVHEGSQARIIRPKNKRFLRFIGRGGQPVFARQVNMPARRARPWLRNALEQVGRPAGFRVTP